MGSCFHFSFRKKQSYAFNNPEPYTPSGQQQGRYRASVHVPGWGDNPEVTYRSSTQNGLQNGHHSPEPPSTPTEKTPYDVIYDTADPPNHVVITRRSPSPERSPEVLVNGHGAEDSHSASSKEEESAGLEPVNQEPAEEVHAKKEEVKKKDIPPHELPNPPPHDHKLNDYEKTMLEMAQSEEFHEHHTVRLGCPATGTTSAGLQDDDDAVSSVSSHASINLHDVEEEEDTPTQDCPDTPQYYEEYDLTEDKHTPPELVY